MGAFYAPKMDFENIFFRGTYTVHLTPRRRGLIWRTYLWAGGFQRYRKSLKIGHKQFYGQLNDKEW